MKPEKKMLRLIALCVMLCLILAATVIFSLQLISFKPVYKQSSSIAPAVSSSAGTVISSDNQQTTLSQDQSVVSIVQSAKAKAEDLAYNDIKEMVQSAVEQAGGLQDILSDGMTVVIKPNLVTPIDYTLPGSNGKPLNPEVNGTTTDYRVTRAVVELVRQLNPSGKVYVMEGSSFDTEDCMKQLNYTPEYIPGVDEFIAIEDDSGPWRDYDSSQLIKVPVKDPRLEGNDFVYMNKRYYEADVLISLPVLKTHWTEVVSGAIKNVGIGATPANIYGTSASNNLRYNVLDHDKTKLDQWIADWFTARPVTFAIIDGLQGIQNGPTPSYDSTGTTDIRQDQMNTRLILAGRDSVAVDTISSLIMEWDPAAVGYLGHLAESRAGNSDVSKIHVVGKRVDEVRKDFKGTAPEGKFTDLKAPSVQVKNAQLSNGVLTVDITGDGKARKVEVYKGGEYLGTCTPANSSAFTVTVDGLGAEAPADGISLHVYDQYMNYAELQVDLKANAQK